MNIGLLELILIVFAVLSIIASFIINLMSSAKVSRLSEGLSQLESCFEEKLAVRKKRSDSRESGSAVRESYSESAFIPISGKSEKEQTSKVRYRPPAGTAIFSASDPGPSREKTPPRPEPGLSVSTLETENVLIVKNTRNDGKPAFPLSTDLLSAETEKGKDQNQPLTNPPGSASGLSSEPHQGIDIRDIYQGDFGGTESEIMDVIEDKHETPPGPDKPESPP